MSSVGCIGWLHGRYHCRFDHVVGAFSKVGRMSHASMPEFRTLHALRIKGFATVDTLVEMTAQSPVDVQAHLDAMANVGHAQFREARSLWQLTPDGRTAHGPPLAADLAGADLDTLGQLYEQFLGLNTEFKTLCGDWQLRNGEVNDHSDPAYDAEVVGRLAELDAQAQPIVTAMGALLARLEPYAPRLSQTLTRVQGGETNMFTGVMCGSYHDAWMELHEDLILTQGIDRHAEGSF